MARKIEESKSHGIRSRMYGIKEQGAEQGALAPCFFSVIKNR